VREERLICFDREEALAALRFYAEYIERRSLAMSRFDRVELEGDDAASAEVVGTAGGGSSSRHAFTGDRLSSALVYWCLSRHVSLPRRGPRRVQIRNGELQLRIELDGKTDSEASALLLDAA
jgi:hypothetical protein